MTGDPQKRPWPFGAEDQVDAQTSSQVTPPNLSHASQEQNTEPSSTICFGSIISVNAQLSCNGELNDTTYEGSAPYFDVVQQGSYFALKFSGISFARLSKSLCEVLQTLTAQNRIWMKGHASGEDWNEAVHSSARGAPTLLSVEINLFGTKKDAKEVGCILLKSNIYLQRPQYDLCGVEYYNPHLLQIEGYSGNVLTEMPRSTRESSVNSADGVPEYVVQVNDSDMVGSILDSLSHHIHLQEFSGDARVRSALLDHQKEAVDFIFQIEAGKLPPERSLWKYSDADAEVPFYEHVLTGAKRPSPVETRGGIIADEMGLGKTLVMLSTIASSAERAGSYADESLFPSAQLRGNRRSKATLIITPSAHLIDIWVSEVYKHTFPGTLPFHKHLGPSRHRETDLLHERIIVFTTYATVAADFCRGDPSLSKVHWFRIILDEAHDIRNRSTRQFNAVASIPAQHRWCLTGTPIQNSLDDLGALVSFLKMPILEKAPAFRKVITNPLSSNSRHRFKNLQMLLQSICLRRTREVLKDLPEPITIFRKLPLTVSEQVQYHGLLQQCKTDIDMAVSQRQKGKIKSAMLLALTKLRLFCNNGRDNAVPESGPTGIPVDPDEALTHLEQNGENICARCGTTIESISSLAGAGGGVFLPSCRHLVCRYCNHPNSPCPICRSQNESMPLAILPPISSQVQLGGRIENTNAAQTQEYPSKLLGLLSDIREDPNQKSIVFSGWKKTLGLVSQLLHDHQLPHHMIDGSHPLKTRIKILDEFRQPTGANILLMTLGTGAVGLNLAAVSRVHLLEPQWNPSIESQAIGRALRLDQQSRVTIFRYSMSETVEESNVLSLQRRKLELVSGGFKKEKKMQPERFQALLDVFDMSKQAVSQ